MGDRDLTREELLAELHAARDRERVLERRVAEADGRFISSDSISTGELRESEQHFAGAFHKAPGYMVVTAVDDGRVVDINEAFSHWTGYRRDDIVGQSADQLRLWDDIENHDAVLAEILEKGSIEGVASDFTTLAGDEVSALLSAEVITVERETCIVWKCTDITADLAAQQELRQQRERLRAVLSSIDELPVALVDRQGFMRSLIGASPGAGRLGLDQFDIQGHRVNEFGSGDLGDRALELVREVFDTGESRSFETSIELGGHRGEYEVWYAPVLAEDGGVDSVLAISRDITDRKRSEEALRFSEEIYRSLTDDVLDSSAVGVCILDAEFNVAWMNRALEKFLGIHRHEVVGTDQRQLVRQRLRWIFANPDDFYSRVFRTYEDNTYVENFTCHVTREGEREERWLEHWSQPITSGLYTGGRIEHYTDITRRKSAEVDHQRLEAKVRETQKLESLGVLAGDIAHNFNNILVGILGNARIALRDMPDSSKLQEPLIGIETAAQRASELTHQMLAYLGRSPFTERPLDLSALIEEMTKLIAASISKSVVLDRRLSAELPPIDADATQLRQVVMNLIVNASEACEANNGAIVVTTRTEHLSSADLGELARGEKLGEGNYVCLEVADSGTGMTPRTRNKIFDPFFSTKFAGRGLGLAAVLGIVRSHRGGIALESKKGVGTTIRVYLPCSPELSLDLGPPSVPDVDGAGTILVIDDEETVRHVAGRALEHQGFSALLAANAKEGLEIFGSQAEEIRAVLLDLSMQGMGGENTLDALRLVRSDVPVIITSGFNENEVSSRFEETRPSGFLKKPFRPAELGEKLQEVIAGAEED
ncbi:MAG: PAS domain S-box protein [Myxococcales bacterium]|nr:PAS domain S-box protein [Myxococcales bacterium]